MNRQALAIPATLFATGALGSAADAATSVDITASVNGTAISFDGSSTQYRFFTDANGENPYLEGALVTTPFKEDAFNQIGTVSATPYYPGAGDSRLDKEQSTAAEGYYGLRFTIDGSTPISVAAAGAAASSDSLSAGTYTGWALVDQGGFRISEVDFRLAAVPEPATWAMMILGMGAVGAAMRQRRRSGVAAAA